MKTMKKIHKTMKTAFFAVVLLGMFSMNALAWKFVVYGDTRSNPNDHEDALQTIKDYAGSYDFIINVGDVAARGERDSDWEMWKNSMRDVMGSTMQSGSPFYISCPGNHDNTEMNAGLSNWHQYLSKQKNWGNDGLYFVMDHNNARFIILNDEKRTTAQKNFLQNAIETNTKEWLFAVWHAPVIPYGDKSYDGGIHRDFAQPLHEGGCDIIWNGDAHTYARTKKLIWDGSQNFQVDNNIGTTQIITGNSGADRDPISNPGSEWGPAADLITGGYLTNNRVGMTIIDVSGDQLTLKHYLKNGNKIDQVTLTANPKDGSGGGGGGSTVPADPTNFSASAVSCSKINLSWRDNADNEDEYKVKISTDGATYSDLAVLAANTESYSATNLNESTTYYFKVLAKNSAGSSSRPEASASTPSCSGGGGEVTKSYVSASDDAYVRNGTYNNTNYGSNAELQIKQTSTANAKRWALVKFDLSDIGTVTYAKLKFESTGNSGPLDILKLGDNWDESTVTWSNQPSKGTTIASVDVGAPGKYNVDVTSYVAAQADGDNTASFVIKGTSTTKLTLSSKEGVFPPKLVIDHDGIPRSANGVIAATIDMYPNPTTGKVNISINDVDFTNGIINVYSGNGALIESIEVDNANSTIELDGEAGMYLLEVNYNGNVKTFSVIKK